MFCTEAKNYTKEHDIHNAQQSTLHTENNGSTVNVLHNK